MSNILKILPMWKMKTLLFLQGHVHHRRKTKSRCIKALRMPWWLWVTLSICDIFAGIGTAHQHRWVTSAGLGEQGTSDLAGWHSSSTSWRNSCSWWRTLLLSETVSKGAGCIHSFVSVCKEEIYNLAIHRDEKHSYFVSVSSLNKEDKDSTPKLLGNLRMSPNYQTNFICGIWR